MHDIQPIIDRALRAIETHRLDQPGSYARWIWQDEKGSRELGLNEYGCADAANILYMVGAFPSDPAERAIWVETLRSFQNPETGLFNEATHHPYHTTAHCIAALELDAELRKRLEKQIVRNGSWRFRAVDPAADGRCFKRTRLDGEGSKRSIRIGRARAFTQHDQRGNRPRCHDDGFYVYANHDLTSR